MKPALNLTLEQLVEILETQKTKVLYVGRTYVDIRSGFARIRGALNDEAIASTSWSVGTEHIRCHQGSELTIAALSAPGHGLGVDVNLVVTPEPLNATHKAAIVSTLLHHNGRLALLDN